MDDDDQIHIYSCLSDFSVCVIIEPAAYIKSLPKKPKADYKQLFGYKRDSQGEIISGISEEGKCLIIMDRTRYK